MMESLIINGKWTVIIDFVEEEWGEVLRRLGEK